VEVARSVTQQKLTEYEKTRDGARRLAAVFATHAAECSTGSLDDRTERSDVLKDKASELLNKFPIPPIYEVPTFAFRPAVSRSGSSDEINLVGVVKKLIETKERKRKSTNSSVSSQAPAAKKQTTMAVRELA